jgi:FkbM family methyltransferase
MNVNADFPRMEIASRLRRAVNYPYFVWYTRKHPKAWRGRKMFRIFNYSRSFIKFWEASSDRDLLLECPLRDNSVVLDVGGFTGQWAKAISERYRPFVHVFEPSLALFKSLKGRFEGDNKVRCHPFGLAGQDRKALLCSATMGSSIYPSCPSWNNGRDTHEINLKDVKSVIEQLGIDQIDLMKINIEGGEFELLDRMIESGVHLKCRHIRVQFHEWYPGARARRKQIRAKLKASHEIEWDYAFVWESWRRKDACAEHSKAA